ncbi:hypothetical protein TNCV_823951 [Trichonephila clavipes]|nr:hypothetical protein TNCV_823951 [Trichonephila clavipes]
MEKLSHLQDAKKLVCFGIFSKHEHVGVVTYTTRLTVTSDQSPRNSSRLEARFLCMSLTLALSIMQVTVRFCRFLSNFEGEHPGGGKGPHLSSLPIYFMRGPAARRAFRLPPCGEDTIHLETTMSFPGFEPKHYGTAVSITNLYTR